MRLALRLVGVTIIFGTSAPSALAEHAKIQLDIAGRRDQVTAYVDQTPPEWGKNPRPVLKVRCDEPVKVQFLLTNIYPHKTLENVVVHFFVVREEKAGQKEIPDLKGQVILESAFDMDLKPGGKVGQRTTLRIADPGAYLVRIETRNTQSDHEHFAAIDLIVIGEEKP
jgi:hypothetical protein